MKNNNLSGGMVVAGFNSLPAAKNIKNEKKMKTQVTKENYREYLADIEAEFNLEEVTSVSARNGYPEGILPLMVGLESEEQANEILEKYPQVEFFELEWKDGWQTKYRLNHLSGPRCYEADDELKYDNDISGLWHKGDNVREFEIFYLGEGLQDECKELIRDLNELGLSIDEPQKKYEDCGIEEYNEFYERADKLVTDAQNEEIADIPEYVFEELEEIQKRVQEVIDMRQELLSLHDGEVLRVDLERATRVMQEKSMSYYDGDVTHRCIAVGFDPDFLPSEEEIEDEEEEE